MPSFGFMTRKQASDEFGLSESFLAHLHQSILPRYPFGGRVLYDRSEVIAAIKGARYSDVLLPSEPKPHTPKKRGRPAKTPISESR